MKHFEKYIGIAMLLFSIGFNLWIYRLEPTAKVDPNDNTFQFALVERTNQIWDVTRSSAVLADHWVPNWASGYNLPYYYSHIPQIIIVASYRLVSVLGIQLSLFQYYHVVIYALLCLFPLSVFAALRIIGLSWVTSGVGAIIASHLSTDGLYGLDPTSFLWRGYGLSSQLFSMIWLPLSIAFAFCALSRNGNKTHLPSAILLLAATTAGHLGIGIIAFMSIGILAVSPYIQTLLSSAWNRQTANHVFISAYTLFLLFGGVGLMLGYWILPILTNGDYHNISVWDGIWKFDSFGYREVLKNLFNGDLFDFGRLPVLTALVAIGFFASFGTPLFPFAVLFVFWLLFYFGRTTWGGLFSLIPGMNEFHLSRFIVGVHLSGLFLIPVGMEWIITNVQNLTRPKRTVLHLGLMLATVTVLVLLAYPQAIRYAAHNDFLIRRANTDHNRDNADISLLQSTLKRELEKNPGRVFAGRGGSWGKDFRIAETPMYMHLSTYGIPVILWLPETWSPNSDTEQYFSESNPDHYTLYNVRYVATPVNLQKEHIQPFWKLLEAGKTWKLYSVESANPGYISAGVRPAIVSSSKADYRSLVRLWMHADYIKNDLYPQLTFASDYPRKTGLPNFRMLDEVTYIVPDGSTHNLFAEVPRYMNPLPEGHALASVQSQSTKNDMIFTARVDVPEGCTGCIVILKQSFHPSWSATVDGKPIEPFAVFPFYTAVSVEQAGTHEIIFSYGPSVTKKLLLVISFVSLLGLFYGIFRRHHAIR